MPGYHQLPYDFCKFLSMEGYDVTLILPKRKNESEMKGDGFNVIYLKSILFSFGLPITPTLHFCLKKENFDIIISSEDFQPMTFISALHAHKHSKPFFIISEKYFPSRFFILRQLYKIHLKFLAPLIWSTSNMIIAHSNAAKEFLIDNGAPEQKVVYLPIGVDTDKFKPSFTNNSSQIVLLSVARLIPQKNLFRLIDAMKLVIRKNENIKLLIHGKGYLFHKLHEKILNYGLNNQITIDNQNISDYKLVELYNSCGAFVLNSQWEPVGISILEAMACGKPVIVANVGGMPDFVIDGVNGYIMDPNEPADLAEKIEEICDIEKREAMSKESIRLVKEKYDWRIVIKEYKILFERHL